MCTESDHSAAESTPPGEYSIRATAQHSSIRFTVWRKFIDLVTFGKALRYSYATLSTQRHWFIRALFSPPLRCGSCIQRSSAAPAKQDSC